MPPARECMHRTTPLGGLRAAACVFVATLGGLLAVSAAHAAETSALAPPVNHESGHIESMLTATDQGYRYTAYVVQWRDARIVVTDRTLVPRQAGDSLDFVVHRQSTGRNILRFDSGATENDNEVDEDGESSTAAITLGTSKIDEVVSVDSDGYRFAGYFVNWHEQRVFIPDPLSQPLKSIGDTVNFRVLHTSLGGNKVLSFSSQ